MRLGRCVGDKLSKRAHALPPHFFAERRVAGDVQSDMVGTRSPGEEDSRRGDDVEIRVLDLDVEGESPNVGGESFRRPKPAEEIPVPTACGWLPRLR
jgi:hypothetical protein